MDGRKCLASGMMYWSTSAEEIDHRGFLGM